MELKNHAESQLCVCVTFLLTSRQQFVANFKLVGEKMKNILHCRIVGLNWYLYVRFFAVSKKEKEKRPHLA